MKYGILGVFLSVVFSISARADREACPDLRYQVDNTILEQGYFQTTQTCFVSVRHHWPKELIYRSYMFTSTGMLMTFNSFGDGPSSTMTGASEFYFLPTQNKPQIVIEGEEIAVIMANGTRVDFDAKTAHPTDLERGRLWVDQEVRHDNGGGVRVLDYDGLHLDMGFQLGMNPSYYLNRFSHFVDSQGQRCRVRNSAVFDKKGDEVYFRYPRESELRRYLSRACPNLVF